MADKAQGKRMKVAQAALEQGKAYPLADAVRLVKAGAKCKFDETIDIAVNLGIDARQSEQAVRCMVNLPNGSGRSMRVAVFAKGDKIAEAKQAGADMVGEDELIAEVEAGDIKYDRYISTPDLMARVGKLGKVLGPRGLMPNPRTNTVTADVGAAVRAAKGGAIELRTEKAGIVHAGIGKSSFKEQQLMENVLAVVETLKRSKPAASKGQYLKRVAISSTMGPSVRLDIAGLST